MAKPVIFQMPTLGAMWKQLGNTRVKWLWDHVIPANDMTLIAAYMKKGKTTLLTGLCRGLLHRGHYCGKGVGNGRKVLYLAPEEHRSLLHRFELMDFLPDEPGIRIVPQASEFWEKMVHHYRMREWGCVVEGWKIQGFDTIFIDGLHTVFSMFEPQAKDDNDTVMRFMNNFMRPLTANFTVVAALHTKKGNHDPRYQIPEEETVRGSSTWIALAGQVLVMEHDRKRDLKTFKMFGRYNDYCDQDLVLKYNPETHDYEDASDLFSAENALNAKKIKEDIEKSLVEKTVVEIVDAVPGVTLNELKAKVGRGRAKLLAILEELVAREELEVVAVTKGRQNTVGYKKGPKAGQCAPQCAAREGQEGVERNNFASFFDLSDDEVGEIDPSEA